MAGVLLWLLTVSTVRAPELLLSMAAAMIGAVFARLTRRALGFRIRFPHRVLRWLATLPGALAVDVGATLVSIARAANRKATAGRRRTVDWAAGRSARSVGWRASPAMIVSATPGTLVLDVDPDSGRSLAHELLPGHPGPIGLAVP